jgi:hypothetical protein
MCVFGRLTCCICSFSCARPYTAELHVCRAGPRYGGGYGGGQYGGYGGGYGGGGGGQYGGGGYGGGKGGKGSGGGLGAGLRDVRDWDLRKLPAFEKNFYYEVR